MEEYESSPNIASYELFDLFVGQVCSLCPPKESHKPLQNYS